MVKRKTTNREREGVYKDNRNPFKPLLNNIPCGYMLGPYITSDSPITIVIVALIVIVVPLLSPYCYYCSP